VADYSLLLSGCTKGNAVPYTLGAGQSSKSACLYQIKYMSKDGVAITASASVLIDAYNHNKQYASTAEDAGSIDRKGKFYCQRALNHSTMELEGHQAASLVTSLPSSGSSDTIHFYSGWDIQRLARTVAEGVFDDVNFSNDVLDDDDTNEGSDLQSDSDDEVNELLRAVPPEVLLNDRYKTTPTVDLLSNTNDTTVENEDMLRCIGIL
jgi:hypothetical protein